MSHSKDINCYCISVAENGFHISRYWANTSQIDTMQKLVFLLVILLPMHQVMAQVHKRKSCQWYREEGSRMDGLLSYGKFKVSHR